MVAIQIQECSQLIQVFCMRQSKCLYIIYTGNFLNRVQTIFILQNESFSFVYYQRCMQTSGHATIFLLHCFSQIIRNNHPTASNYAPNKWMTYKPAVHISFKKMCKKHTQFTFPKQFLKDSSSFVFMATGDHRNVAIPTSWQEMVSCCEIQSSLNSCLNMTD